MIDILNNRFNSLLKEIDQINDIILKEHKNSIEVISKIESIYKDENSTFDKVLEKLHLDKGNADIQFNLATEALGQLVPRSIELHNLFSLLKEEPEFESNELKVRFLEMKERMGEQPIIIENGQLERVDSEYTDIVNKAKAHMLEKLRNEFELTKQMLKDAK